MKVRAILWTVTMGYMGFLLTGHGLHSSQILRRILVDHARSRGYDKRGGKALHVPLDEVLVGARARGIEMLALDEALEALSKIDARKARVVELRYFGGLSIEETSEVMGISPETIKRDWKMAKAWLLAVLTGNKITPSASDDAPSA
jgi:RNA polymerase sigma factor (TIGR02999 family)